MKVCICFEIVFKVIAKKSKNMSQKHSESGLKSSEDSAQDMAQHSGDDSSDQSMATSVAMDTSVYEMPESAPIEQSIHISGSDVSVDPLKPFVVRKVVDHSMATSSASLESSRDTSDHSYGQ